MDASIKHKIYVKSFIVMNINRIFSFVLGIHILMKIEIFS